jgi:hypothetical protein
MKIQYVFDWNGSPDAGVVTKVESQIRAWMYFGVEVELINICTIQSRIADKEFPVRCFVHRGGHSRYWARWKANRYLTKNSSADLVFRRYGLLLPFEIMALSQRKTIIELNTNNDYFYSHRNVIQKLWNIFQRKKIGDLAIGACAVTNEIAQIHAQRFKDIKVFTNGTQIPTLNKTTHTRSGPIKMLFLLGDDFEWNGIWLLEKLAEQLPEYTFEITGNLKYEPINANISVNPFVSRSELAKHLTQFSFGISSLMLENVGLTEAAPLKNRTYLINGLPIIARYPDSAFPTGSKEYFCLEFNNLGKLLNLAELKEFIAYWSVNSIGEEELLKIDIYEIEKSRLKHIRKILEINSAQ